MRAARRKRTHCKRGHTLTEDTVYYTAGVRGCKLCKSINAATRKKMLKTSGRCACCEKPTNNGKTSCDLCLTRRNVWQKTKRQELRASYVERKTTLVNMLGGKCKDCGYSGHMSGFEFDHLRDKKYCVSTLLNSASAWETIVGEAMKCELVCATCHRIRTWERGTYKKNIDNYLVSKKTAEHDLALMQRGLF